MCVGLVQKISARCNTGSYVFSFFFICIFILLLALSHIYVFLFPQRVPSDLEVGHEKSILTRTEILFYHYLFQRTPVICDFISQENVFLFAIYFHQNMKLGPDKFFLSRDSQKLCLRQHQLRNQRQLRLRNSLVAFYPQKATPYNETF